MKLRAISVLLLGMVLVGLVPMSSPHLVEAQGDIEDYPYLMCMMTCAEEADGSEEAALQCMDTCIDTYMCPMISAGYGCFMTLLQLQSGEIDIDDVVELDEACIVTLLSVLYTCTLDEGCRNTCLTICDGQDETCIVEGFACLMDYYGCNPAANPACGFADLRLDQYACAAPVAVYCDGSSAAIYAIDGSGSGDPLMTVDLPATIPAENMLIAEASGVSVYQLTTGEFQVNALDAEGNPYVLVWDACPASSVYQVK